MEYVFDIKTRYSETAQDKIIHHSSYIIYLEEARIAYLKKMGMCIHELESKNIFCPVVDLNIKYLKPLNSGEDIKIIIKIDSFSKVRFKFNYIILCRDEKIAEANSSHCFVNSKFKPIALMASFNEALIKLLK